MALLRTAGLCRLALRTHWAAVRLLSSAAGGEPSAGEAPPGRRVDLEALRRERTLRPPAAWPVPASPEVGFSPSRPSREQVQLNRALTTCDDVNDVLDLVVARWPLLNCVTVSTALSVIARLLGKREPALWLKDDERFRQLMRGALLLFERQEMDAQGFSNVFYACGQLGIVPPKSWLRVYWERSPSVIGAFKPQELSNTIYACGQLGITPPADWLERFWHASAVKLGDFVPQALSNTLYACGLLGLAPPADWLGRFWHASALKLSDFIPQNLSNTLYACGQLSIVPPDYWLHRFWIASAVKLEGFIPQHFSNTIYACGLLASTPPPDWMQRFWQASAATLGDFTPQALSNTLLACGLLDTKPPPNWLQRFSSGCEQALSGMKQQELANTALALAMLQLWDLTLWRGLWERLCRSLSRDVAGWSSEDRLGAMQLYQALRAAAVERPGLLLAPTPELLAAARKSWIDQVRDGGDYLQTGRFHDDVSAYLTRMGVAHANERWCDRAERRIDIVIEGTTPPVALEVDGPSHFLQDGRPDGSTLLRNRMLAAHGWRVVVVDFRAWIAQKTLEQREEYLRRLLAS
jgi:hypothetical protein